MENAKITYSKKHEASEIVIIRVINNQHITILDNNKRIIGDSKWLCYSQKRKNHTSK